MANHRTGRFFTCPHCNEQFYRRGSHILRGITKTCGKRECISASMMGAGNPFWGKNHTEEVTVKLSKLRRARADGVRKPGPAKGSYKASAEARAKISEAVKRDWKLNRDKRLMACAKSGETQRANSLNKEPRYRLQFTPMQRRDWTASSCVWCDATEDLVLDHIIPVMAGGTNHRANAQTLCRKCNLWKMRYVDRAYLLATLGSQEGSIQP